MAEDDDAALLQRWRDGDERAGSRLLERHVVRVSRFFRSKVAAAAEDLIQQTFLACVEGRHRVRDGTSFSAYLFGAARNVLRAHLRAIDADRKNLDFESQSIADLAPGAHTNLARRRDQRAVLEALRRIPLDLQIALEVVYWEGLSGAELAEVLEVPHPTARSRLRRAKELFEGEYDALQREARLDTTGRGLTDWAAAIRDVARDDG
ncbi:MAG: sigma-70 family RNA polymerase sigma factor [Myxococcota bacterium]